MAIIRDIGIQFPSDQSIGINLSPVTGRTPHRFIARGSRYSHSLGTKVGWDFGIGTSFFGNTLPGTSLGPPPEVPYTRFIDVRKTQLVDSIKERISGSFYRAGLDTLTEVENDNALQTQDSIPRKGFPAKLTGTVVSALDSGGVSRYRHEWFEVVWNEPDAHWDQKQDGRNSFADIALQGAMHKPSSGRLALPFEHIVTMNFDRSTGGGWAPSFHADFAGELLGRITARSDAEGINISYDIESVHNPLLEFIGVFPSNRVLDGATYVAATVGDPCTILIESLTNLSAWFIVFTEYVETVVCPAPANAEQLGGGSRYTPDSFYVHYPNAAGAIGQAM